MPSSISNFNRNLRQFTTDLNRIGQPTPQQLQQQQHQQPQVIVQTQSQDGTSQQIVYMQPAPNQSSFQSRLNNVVSNPVGTVNTLFSRPVQSMPAGQPMYIQQNGVMVPVVIQNGQYVAVGPGAAPAAVPQPLQPVYAVPEAQQQQQPLRRTNERGEKVPDSTGLEKEQVPPSAGPPPPYK
ncbi:hypothetical protein HDU97_010008 [Phlyctochytrium planicorne]|nr:hypothetical protein HDU97_010008 [Phlyctochytrium planicorne]